MRVIVCYWTEDTGHDFVTRVKHEEFPDAQYATFPKETFIYNEGKMRKAVLNAVYFTPTVVTLDYDVKLRGIKPETFFHDLGEYGCALIDNPEHPHNNVSVNSVAWFTLDNDGVDVRKQFICKNIDADNEGRALFTWRILE